MKRNIFSVLASVVFAGALVAAQDSPSPSPDPAPAPRESAPAAAPAAPAASQAPQAAQPAPAPAQDAKEVSEVTVTGCLVQGSGPTVFILENAKMSTDPKDAKGKRYVLEISAPADKIKTVVNHQVTIVGAPAATVATAPPGASAEAASEAKKASESDLPKFTAKRISPQSQTCSA